MSNYMGLDSQIVQLSISDHYGLLVTKTAREPLEQGVKYRSYRRLETAEGQQNLNFYLQHDLSKRKIYEIVDLNAAYEQLTDALKKTIDKYCPEKQKKSI